MVSPNSIAIVGLSGRFPDAPDLDTLWQNLRVGRESIARFSEAELLASGVLPEIFRDPAYVPAAAVLDGIENFDADFFGISAREAELTDPQHRLFLECAWEALESAGYVNRESGARVGVYAGTGISGYWIHHLATHPEIASTVGDIQLLLGNGADFLSSRLSYKLDLTGPSVAIGTACSTSLVAIHLACQSLLDFHCDLALAGGVSIPIPQRQGYLYHEGGIQSSDGHCRPFDAKAGGTMTGSAAGVLALRRLEDALAARDTIHAVILATAVNNDGSQKIGFTAPSELGQAAVIAEALALAGLSPEKVTLIEAHGTGTPLGDPIELAALTRVFRAHTGRRQFCALGSIKSNFGHTDQAAGVAGVIKAVLALKHRTLPPSLNFETPNPKLDLRDSPFYVPTAAVEWRSEEPRRAGVSSFGIGGTNAHAILEEAPRIQPAPALRPARLLVCSARSATALERLCENLARHLEEHPEQSLDDAAFTLAVGRRAFLHRRAVTCTNTAEAVARLRGTPSVSSTAQATGAVFLFPGQGSQYVGMGAEIYRAEPAFREAFDACAKVARETHDLELRREERRPAEDRDAPLEAQPALFAVEYALAMLLRSWGVEPVAMIGHSLGEYVAATLAGVFTMEDALSLVISRARLVQSTPQGAMLAVPLSKAKIEPLLNGTLSIAAANTPEMTVISGRSSAIAELEARIAERGLASVRLRSSRAFHSAALDPILEEFAARVRRVTLRPPQLRFISNVTGDWITPAEATDSQYWVRHLREPVRFSEGIARLFTVAGASWIEIGPGRVLAGLVNRHPERPAELRILSTLPPANGKCGDSATILESLGELWRAGLSVNWKSFFAGEQRHRVPLPTYPFERRRYWIEAPSARTAPMPAPARAPTPAAIVPPAAPAATLAIDNWFYVLRWHRLDAAAAPPGVATPWIVFADAYGIADAVAGHLRKQGAAVIMVRPGAAFDRTATDEFSLPVEDAAAHAQLWRELKDGSHALAAVLYLAALQAPGSMAASEVAQAELVKLLAMAQGLGAQASPRKLAIVTNNTQAVTGADLLYPAIAPLWGATRTIAAEYPNLACTLFDLDLSGLPRISPADIAAELVPALDGQGSTIALRAGALWEGRIERAALAPAGTSRVRERGAYLITGGLGSMGLAFAAHLAETARARVALVSRRALAWPRPRFPLLAEGDSIARIESAARHGDSSIVPLTAQPGLEPLLKRFCAALVAAYFAKGVADEMRLPLSQLRARLGLLEKFATFFDILVKLVVAENFACLHGAEIELQPSPGRTPEALGAELAARWPQFVPLAQLIAHCVERYPAALSGEIPGVTVLYPDGSPHWLESFLAQIPNYSSESASLRAAADLVARLAASRPEPLSILEVGGGAGNLTQHLLELIAAGRVEYHFTDIAPTFVGRMREDAEVRGLHRVRFGQFDISQPAETQGLRAQSYDLVLGYNVVHATPDLVHTARNLRLLLKPGGALVLVETVQAPCWIDLIWGLTDGWWAFTDRERRQFSPLISIGEWERVLAEAGFVRSAAYPRDPETRAHVDAGVIVAEAPVIASASAPGIVEERLARIEALGGEVCVITADISDPLETARAIAEAQAAFGPLHGVIHAAGVLGQTMIREHTPAELQRVLAPKVNGVLNLAAALGETSLDFFVLCSSMSALAPIPGQFAYSAGNAFLDAFATSRAMRASGLTVSIDWDFWQELGMIEQARTSSAAKQAIRDEIVAEGWENRGVEIFARVLAGQPPAQLVVSPGLPKLAAAAPFEGAIEHGVLHEYQLEKDGRLAVFSGSIAAGASWLVDEHRIAGHAILPGTAYLDLVVAAFWRLRDRQPLELSDVFFLSPMLFAEGEKKVVRVILEKREAGGEFRVVSRLPDGRWQEHARGEVSELAAAPGQLDLDALEAELAAAPVAEPEGFSARVQRFAPHWRNVTRAAFGSNGQALAQLDLASEFAGDAGRFALHPALLDTATGFLAFRPEHDEFVPFTYRRIRVFAPLPTSFTSVFRMVSDESDAPLFSGSLVDATGRELLSVEDYALRRASPPPSGERTEEPAPAGFANVQLEVSVPGQLETLAYRPALRIAPGAGEVEIEVRAAGLNFIEVLYALGLLPNPVGGRFALGQECAGVVVRAGAGARFHPGEEVIAYGLGCFSLFATVSETAVALKPAHLSFEEAAGLPASYATAWHSLIHLARLREGERVLIHAAAGGVGLAAVRLAQWRRAEIFVTAGSESKRQFLRELGVPHVMDSRSLAFADEVRRLTAGEGIDVVLNSLAGEFIPASLALLRRHGRFLELGKRDLFADRPLGLGAFARFIAFFAVDIGPDLPGFAEMWVELTAHLQAGTFPPAPHQTFPAAEARHAFEHMAQARHLGKIVLSFADRASILAAADAPSPGLRWEDLTPSEAEAIRDTGRSASGPPVLGAEFTEHARPALSTEFSPAESPLEKTVATIWEKLLGVAPIGADDDFFQLKGDSLLAAQVMSRLHRELEVRLPLSLIFDFPTVRTLAAQIEKCVGAPTPAISIVASRAAPDEDACEVSHAQRRLWVLSQLETSSAAYNVPLRLLLEGELDRAALATALSQVVARHEALRTTFRSVDGELRQVIHPAAAVPLRELDLTGEGEPGARLRAQAEAEAEPFDLEAGPLLRASLARLGPSSHVLELNIHHIACDGWSLRVIVQDLRLCYLAATNGRVPEMEPLRRQYRDYAAAQNQALASEEMGRQREYWLARLGGELPMLDLPMDGLRPAFQSFAGRQLSFRFEAAVMHALRDFARARRTSVFSVLAAVVKVLLHRYTGQRDIIVGTADAGRNRPEFENQVGCYLNTLALRDVIDPEASFETVVRQVRETVLEALDHRDYPFDHLIEALALRRDLSRSPLFDVMIISQTADELTAPMGKLNVSPLPQASRASKFDLTFDCEEGIDFLHIGIEYNSDLFVPERIARMGEHLGTLLKGALREPGLAVHELPLLSPAERESLLGQGPCALVQPGLPSVTQRITQAVQTWPHGVAIVQGEHTVTYAELGARVHAIASRLRDLGVGAGDVVGVLGSRSPDMVAALVGVLEAGAAYLPLDALYPADRLRYMIKDSGARYVIADAPSGRVLPDDGATVLSLETDFPAGMPSVFPIEPLPEELAYVIYTSGSTGLPKGVEISRGALANFLASMEREPGVRRDDVVVAVTTVCFDIAVLELLLPLCAGARIVLASAEDAASPGALAGLIDASSATVLQATPATWRMLLADGWPGARKLRAFCGGEALSRELAANLAPRVAELWNLYGPTETTVWSAVRRVVSTSSPSLSGPAEPIGPAIANTRLCALDPWLSPVPAGVIGELFIGGEGVARGYRQRPDITAEKFVPDPFSSVPGARLYRTGDLVRPGPDGTFEFLGRGDHQVKLRGFRIELGEIESVVSTHPDVAEVAVVAREDTLGETVLVAYLVSRTGAVPAGLRELLQERLPSYMVPAAFVCLPRLPLTQNGKVDRRALPSHNPDEVPRADSVPPRTELERALASLWIETLGVKTVGVHDNFFELGGHSLRAARILAAIKETHGAALSLREFFIHPTIAELAALIDQNGGAQSAAARPSRLTRARPVPVAAATPSTFSA